MPRTYSTKGAERKATHITVPVTERTHRALRLRAETSGVSMSEVVRRLLTDELERPQTERAHG